MFGDVFVMLRLLSANPTGFPCLGLRAGSPAARQSAGQGWRRAGYDDGWFVHHLLVPLRRQSDRIWRRLLPAASPVPGSCDNLCREFGFSYLPPYVMREKAHYESRKTTVFAEWPPLCSDDSPTRVLLSIWLEIQKGKAPLIPHSRHPPMRRR